MMSEYNSKNEHDEAIDRISEMEERLDRVKSAVKELGRTLDDFSGIINELQALKKYYCSEKWKQDFQADENGEFPSDMKRGVLSEDAVWNLLEYNRELAETMRNLSDEMLEDQI